MSIQSKSDNPQFTWIPFYTKFADKLLEYKDRRKELLEKLKSLDRDWIYYMFNETTSEWKFSEFDPFTVFAIFNRHINNITRKEITQRLKELFQIKSELPLDFSGIPTAHYNRRIIFDYKKANLADINVLWELFESAINYPNDSFSSLFDKALQVKGIALRNITIALFWVCPDKFITLDSHTQKFLVDNGIQILPKMTGEKYIKLLDTIQHDTHFSGKSFPEISLEAWYNNHAKDDSADKIIEKKREPDSIIKTACRILRIKKNIILQGAPGTGKTYSTAEIALRILGDDVDFSNHKTVMERYEKYRKEKRRLFFTTFHQSMDYEDFVEGVKPKVTDEGVKYIIEKGIFRKVCENASSLFSEKRSNEIDFTKTRIFKMSLGEKGNDDVEVFEYCKENNVVALGWGGTKDFSNCQTRKDFQKSDNTWGAKALEIFKCWMRVGDIVLVSDGNTAVKAIARIIGDYEFHDDAPIDMCQFRKVEWLYTGNSIPISKLYDKNLSQQSIYAFYSPGYEGTKKFNGGIKTDMINDIITAKVNTEKPLPHVLIIDEINRGNVSKIFGELVTLLEKDKREGEDHPITVTLPYSKEEFSVPSNVYIIGTMNTTDRSTGTLDYAVRRRFAFVNLSADREAIQLDIAKELFDDIESFIVDNCPNDMDIDDLMVGHSYFMTEYEDELELKIKYEVVPLLKEYCNDGLLTCSLDELNKRIKAWENLEVFDDSSVETEEETDDEEGEDQE